MRTTILIAVVLGGLVGVCGRLALRGDPGLAPPDAARSAVPIDHVSANAIVEGARPQVALRPEVGGVLRTVHVRENARVTRGTLVAEVANETQKSQVAVARAELASARQQLERLKKGERPEKRKSVAAIEAARRALYEAARSDHERGERARGSVSQQQREQDYFRVLQLKAEWEQAKAERELIEAPPRPEDVAVAESLVEAAQAKLRLAAAELAKTELRAPADGVILRSYAEPGELTSPTSPQPVFLMADLSRRRVRAFVEELDVGRVQEGQTATVTADGLPDHIFTGKVALVLSHMGKRAPESDAPGEFKDLYYREVLIDLDAADELPVNLRVQVRIATSPPTTKE
jgi:HlyD family secretion protein